MKMGGILSEGLVIPINSESFPPSLSHKPDGFDVTDILGVVKYDPEALEEAKLADSGKKKYNFVLRALFRIPAFKQWYFAKNSKSWPSFVAKTDETRIQNLQYVFDLLKGKQVYITEKIDGQSATFALKDGVFYVCSRNLCITKERIKSRSRYPQQQSKYLETAKALDIANRLKQYKKNTGHDIYIQGEQMGEGIQGNKYGMPKGSFLFVFNVYDITEKRYFSNFEVKNFCIEYGFTCVPRVYEGEFIWNNMEEILEFSKGNSLLHDIPREGIVIRSAKALPPERGMANQLSFKVINPDFLVKYNLE
jgi:RNA ligase (TIGR02306 family)